MNSYQSQRGSALIVALLLLIAMTLIGVTTMRTTRLETAMATNAKESAIAFEAAEAAIRDAEQFIEGVVSVGAFSSGANGLLCVDNTACPEPDYYAPASWTAANSQVYGSNPNDPKPALPDVAQQPRYIIKYLGEKQLGSTRSVESEDYGTSGGIEEFSVFRITARGVGRNTSATAIIQTHYGKIF
ncbi:MAG: hypothetical protein Kow006_32650 [Gammaproteobacteria bacterium]